jgi:hypothetical protein
MSENTYDQAETIWGFYEDRYPIYTNQQNCHPELSSPMTVKEANGLVEMIR